MHYKNGVEQKIRNLFWGPKIDGKKNMSNSKFESKFSMLIILLSASFSVGFD